MSEHHRFDSAMLKRRRELVHQAALQGRTLDSVAKAEGVTPVAITRYCTKYLSDERERLKVQKVPSNLLDMKASLRRVCTLLEREQGLITWKQAAIREGISAPALFRWKNRRCPDGLMEAKQEFETDLLLETEEEIRQ